MKIITTSWDDGYEADFKIAELLDKYQLKGTFYIPKANAEKPVMSPSQLQALSKRFEIGGHTLSHVRLCHVDDATLEKEVAGSFHWLADVTGTPPVSFCFPGGAYNKRVVKVAYACGYKVLRTTELLSIQKPQDKTLLATTIQMYEHSSITYFRHLLKHHQWNNFIGWLKTSSTSNILKLSESYLQQIELKGGCFHFWGHSWEIEENDLWGKLEEVFKVLSNRPGFSYVENRDVLQLL